MAMAAVHKIKDATQQGVHTIKAAKGDNAYSADLRKQLAISAGLALVAGAIGFLALRSMRFASEKVVAHDDWKCKDKQLDKDLADSLDASDAVARY